VQSWLSGLPEILFCFDERVMFRKEQLFGAKSIRAPRRQFSSNDSVRRFAHNWLSIRYLLERTDELVRTNAELANANEALLRSQEQTESGDPGYSGPGTLREIDTRRSAPTKQKRAAACATALVD
jgi:hypothetical protein